MLKKTILVSLFIVILYKSTQGAVTGKGLLCVDPDTGKFHEVNTTWPSTTFCGNYTCRIRSKKTDMEISSSINALSINTSNEGDHSYRKAENNSLIITKKPDLNLKGILHKDTTMETMKLVEDRYLNEDEIKTIAEILHSVKKSDLDAIVEIYNLAQDLYKEIDKETTTKAVQDDVQKVNNKLLLNEIYGEGITSGESRNDKYWYEPLVYAVPKPPNTVLTNQNKNILTHPAPSKSEDVSYFRGALSNKDFRKLPYYYPQLLSQKDVNSQQQSAQYIPYVQSIRNKEPCSYLQTPKPTVSWYVARIPSKKEIPKIIQTPLLTPFSFRFTPDYNKWVSTYPFSVNNNPWMQYSNQMKSARSPQTLIGAYPVVDKEENEKKYQENDLLIKTPDFSDNLKYTDVEKIAAKKNMDAETPSWKTPSLSPEILEKVRAHITQKENWFKAFPFRKKLKLEKIGKVIKLDDITRVKREDTEINSLQNENIELYLTSTKCPLISELGYFTKGNLSNPYPACCPYKLNKEPKL